MYSENRFKKYQQMLSLESESNKILGLHSITRNKCYYIYGTRIRNLTWLL